MSARWLVLVNRQAGRRPAAVDAVRSAVVAAGIEFEIEVPGTAREMCDTLQDAASRGIDHFALVGGDGTVNLAANCLLGIAGLPKPIIGILPSGTGCDLLRTFGLPQDLARAAHHLATDQTYDIDVATVVGEWGTRYYVNVAQTGVGAAAAETATKIPRATGAIRYPAAFAARLPRFPPAVVTVKTEKRTYESNALAVIMANAQFFAGGWNVAPKATLVDGVLDMQVIDTKKRRAPSLVPKVIRGTHLRDPAVRRFVAAEYDIATSRPWPVEVDGDYVGNTPVSGRVVRAALTLKI